MHPICAYRIVILIDECPNISISVSSSVPTSLKVVAAVCRQSCSRKFFFALLQAVACAFLGSFILKTFMSSVRAFHAFSIFASPSAIGTSLLRPDFGLSSATCWTTCIILFLKSTFSHCSPSISLFRIPV